MPTPRRNKNRSPLRVSLDDMAGCTESELIKIANSHHGQFVGAMRKAIVEHARYAGAALLELKKNTEHGKWTAWLRDNFKGSPETAQVYMKIAKNWEQLESKHGDQLQDATLAELRQSLAKPSPTTEERRETQARRDVAAKPNVPDDGSLPFAVQLSPEKFKDLEEWTARLGEAWDIHDPSEVVYEAINRMCKEVCDARNPAQLSVA